MILKRFRLSLGNRKIDDLYGAIVAQSRRAAFYIGYGVPDTVDGRFDLVVLHMVLLLARFAGGRPCAILARTCSIFFAAISTPISGKWESGTWPFPNECGSLSKRFMADRPPIVPLLMRRTGESLRRRWRVISLEA
jgi:hypothetical protein